MRPTLPILLAMVAAAGCFGSACSTLPTYPYADVRTGTQPDEATLRAALEELGWHVPADALGQAWHELPDGRTARLVVPSPRGEGIMVSATGPPIETAEESRAILASVAEPLAGRLQGSTTYHGGGQHCGEV